MLRTTSLTYRYPDTPSVLHFPDFTLPEASEALILGASGSGKTTLLHLLAGLRRIQEGEIWFGETALSQLTEQERDRFRGLHIGLVFQRSHFVESISIRDNLLLAAYLAGQKQDKTRAMELLERLQLKEKAGRLPRSLSQGEQQRATIARALMNRPKLLLADEPTSSLDDENCRRVAQMLREQARETKATLLIVTHDARLKSYVSQYIRVGQPS